MLNSILGGTIQESGSNANGRYIKYTDGTLICIKQVTKRLVSVSEWGSLYDAVIDNCGDWAHSFINVPNVLATPIVNSAFIEGIKNFSSTSAGIIAVARPTNISASNPWVPVIDIIAIGKWK